MYSGSSNPFVLETNPQPRGILIESWYLSGSPSIDRAAASTLWDKSFVLDKWAKQMVVGTEVGKSGVDMQH